MRCYEARRLPIWSCVGHFVRGLNTVSAWTHYPTATSSNHHQFATRRPGLHRGWPVSYGETESRRGNQPPFGKRFGNSLKLHPNTRLNVALVLDWYWYTIGRTRIVSFLMKLQASSGLTWWKLTMLGDNSALPPYLLTQYEAFEL